MLKVNRIKILFLVLMLTLTLNLKHSLAGGFCPVSLVTAQVDYGDNGVLAWDPENATQISRNTCADINVEGRQWPEYKWTVTGDGFSLAQLTTTLPTNSLCADSTACGPATITVRGSSSNEQSQTEPINDDIYVYEGGQWQLVSFEGTTNGQYGQKEEDGFKVEEWGCTSCSTDECTVIYEGIDPAIGEIGCLEDCGDFDCVGIIHTARYFKTRAQAEEAALALIATPEFHGAAFSWGCFWQDTPWLNWDLSSIPCNDTECIPHVYLADPEGKICENNLNGELTPDDIAVNSNCPASTEYCATNGKKVWEWICD